ncbi:MULTISPECIES: sensor histidine kinase [unclassified Gilliamella]|uniref:sensor histidine kinase n=1 Tax=unclassified Gilliamella TaxID=2685620 RepID=UPI002269C521|nr:MULTISPECIES: HAMP domain-containing sensor histidine kinase [unclassified Gilliamella]MCX8602263.1 HAMP domain-containing histidine kinase [Gilliamella sp. B3722]MCX8608440.1 HAMP domain-containing histidine kinase [Gilliamella sp. B3771]MCX8611575.1 HAMP domain-containing histidine kinase [Gilliamella sp. B3891]MCX8614042.1 HAMP domain-containing histidine kinase [Gilliamella sp. B3773]MCX8616466.1 HAMP domain-containing histidine kinase [Gilliamella sp. B3770]
MKKLTAILSLCIFIMAFSYLGWRTLEHEVIKRENQEKLLAQSRAENIKSLIGSLLTQRSTYFNSLSDILLYDESNIDKLLQIQTDVKNIFVIDHGVIKYLSNDTDKQWSQLVESIGYDNSILFNHNTQNEQHRSSTGWYQAYNYLVYWSIQSDTIIGFELSNIKLSLDVINLLDEKAMNDSFNLSNDEKQIYNNGEKYPNEIVISLDYPLQNWQLTYYYQSANLTNIYIFGVSVIVLFILIILGLALYCYREYTQTLRLAKQQVSFVGQVSHEFKTPLTNISLYSEMLKERLIDEVQPVPDYLDVITSESNRLTRLVQNVLNFNKPAKLNIKPVNITQLVKQIYFTFRPVLETKSLELNLICDVHYDFMMNTDQDSVIQIISNFLSNAEKYASNGQKVDLILTEQNHKAIITVRDYGNGIANNQLKKIFKPFYRINSSITEGVSGTGIGLTIANQLAQQLNGSIKVTNEKPGVAFSLILMESK